MIFKSEIMQRSLNGSLLKRREKIWGQVFLPRELLSKSLIDKIGPVTMIALLTQSIDLLFDWFLYKWNIDR